MELIQHTIAWCKGEIFEGRIVLFVGLLVALAAFGFWKFGETPYARAAVLPVAVLAALMMVAGASMSVNNTRRIQAYTEAHTADPHAFAQAERERTDDFIAWYPRTRWIFLGVALVGMLLMTYGSPLWRSIGMVLIGGALGVYVIDHFSEERALVYHGHILKALK
ncbi:MAG: hypothetical protein WEC15_07160 [Flavobacteriales bacterium]